MKRLHRRVFFGGTVLVFIVLAPVIILRAMGFRYDPGGGIVQTGALEVRSIPEGAFLFVDGRPVGETPLVVKDLPPGEYHLRLEKEGFFGWEEDRIVEKSLVAREEPAWLFSRGGSAEFSPGVLAEEFSPAAAPSDSGFLSNREILSPEG